METIKAKGHIHIKLYDKQHNLKEERNIDNVVVTVGKTYLAAWLAAASQAGSFMSWIGLGSGTNAANSADTDIQTPLDDRLQGVLTSNSNVWTNTCEFGAGESTGAVAEAGLFSAVTAGTMFARQTFTAVPKGADDTLELVWTVTFN